MNSSENIPRYYKNIQKKIIDENEELEDKLYGVQRDNSMLYNTHKHKYGGDDYKEKILEPNEVELSPDVYFEVEETNIPQIEQAIMCLEIDKAKQKGSSSFKILRSDTDRAISASDIDLGEYIDGGANKDVCIALMYDGVIRVAKKIRENPNLMYKEIKIGYDKNIREITKDMSDAECKQRTKGYPNEVVQLIRSRSRMSDLDFQTAIMKYSTLRWTEVEIHNQEKRKLNGQTIKLVNACADPYAVSVEALLILPDTCLDLSNFIKLKSGEEMITAGEDFPKCLPDDAKRYYNSGNPMKALKRLLSYGIIIQSNLIVVPCAKIIKSWIGVLYSIKTELKNIALYYDNIPQATIEEVMRKFIVTYNDIAIKMPDYRGKFDEFANMTKSAITGGRKAERVQVCATISNYCEQLCSTMTANEIKKESCRLIYAILNAPISYN